MTVRVEVPEPLDVRETLLGLTDAVRPEGDTSVARVTLPVKPPRLLRLIDEVPDWPAKTVMLAVPVEIEKSTTLTMIWTERVREPLVAVTVRV